MRGRFASLTSRLVVTAVTLVLATSVLIGVVTALTVRSYLGGQLDDDVRAALQRAERVPDGPFFGLGQPPFADDPPGGGGPDGDDPSRGQSVGTLTAFFEQYADYDADPTGTVLTQGQRGRPGDSTLSEKVLDRIDDLPVDGRPREVDLPGLGSYRIAVSETSTGSYKVAAGLPTDDVDGVVTTLISTEALLILLGAMMAAIAGHSVVRRQLRPLTEVAETAHSVAELPLDSGEIGVTERVPAHLTDVR
ncbi:MAG: hypothetical protein OSB43_19425, partial [Nocardioides sp.]|nr:hypothetical protein [Nocardioides sp.]